MNEITKLENIVGRNQSIIVDNAMEFSNIVEWSRAITLILSGEAYMLIPRSDGYLIRSTNLSIPYPLVVGLNRYVPRNIRPYTNDTNVSKKTILIRDNYTCQYCFKYGDTVDHIHPKSRGGKNTWGNLCTACKECNYKKSNHTPEEVGMKRPIIPVKYNPRKNVEIQNSIYNTLSEMVYV